MPTRVPSSLQLPGTWGAPWTLNTSIEEEEGGRSPEMPGIQVLYTLKNSQARARFSSTTPPPAVTGSKPEHLPMFPLQLIHFSISFLKISPLEKIFAFSKDVQLLNRRQFKGTRNSGKVSELPI